MASAPKGTKWVEPKLVGKESPYLDYYKENVGPVLRGEVKKAQHLDQANILKKWLGPEPQRIMVEFSQITKACK